MGLPIAKMEDFSVAESLLFKPLVPSIALKGKWCQGLFFEL
jgi:hypothetical protein